MTDFSHILDRVTIPDILASAGIPCFRNRCACPIHGGENPTAFSFTDSTYYCFACGASGGLLDLAQALWGCDRKEAFVRLAAMAGIDLSAEPRSASYPANPPHRRAVCRPDPEIDLARQKVADIKENQQSLLNALRALRKAMTARKLPLSEYYAKEQLYQYELEELDADLAIAVFQYHKLTKESKHDPR